MKYIKEFWIHLGRNFKNNWLPWVLGILLFIVLVLPVALQLDWLKEGTKNYLSSLGGARSAYLGFFSTLAASFTAVMSAYTMQRQKSKKDQRDKLLVAFRTLFAYLSNIKLEYLNQGNPSAIYIDHWQSYLQEVDLILHLLGEDDNVRLLQTVFRAAENYNSAAQKDPTSQAREAFRELDVDKFDDCGRALLRAEGSKYSK